jgi:hypothetical protein
LGIRRITKHFRTLEKELQIYLAQAACVWHCVGMNSNLTWNRGSTETSRKAVSVLTEGTMAAEPGNFKDLRDCPQVVAVAVPFGTTGYKAYDMRDDGKMVRNGKCKIWESLSAIQKHFAAL